jgi:hypothetical protein
MKCFMTHQDCIYERDIQQALSPKSRKSLFLISPFGSPYNEIFQDIVKPAGKKAGLDVWRADVAFQLGFVMCTKICKLMQEATYVVADLTHDNPNVFYELGLAWGFAKNIVIMRDAELPVSRHFKEILGDPGERLLLYEELWNVRDRLSRNEPTKLAETLGKNVIKVRTPDMDRHREPGAYLRARRIHVCCRAGVADAKFYMQEVERAAREVAEKEATNTKGGRKETPGKEAPEDNPSPKLWDQELVLIENEKLSKSLPQKFARSKIVVVDVTHYDNEPDVSMYFALGLSHGMGRETIPITNRARCRRISPFDVRGLWQVYFDNLEQLQNGLVGILDVISPDFENERQDYPLRFIWDKVLKSAGLTVITCARGGKNDKDRAGGRTHVDKWDYASVAELASFLGRKYKQAGIKIEEPREKAETEGLRDVASRDKRVQRIEKSLRSDGNSIIIVGSPDVNDYAEIVLARLCGVPPYQQEPCKRSTDDPLRDKCWECDEPYGLQCLGKRAYLFYKKTIDENNPRKVSDFFRDPPRDDGGDCVLWYGSPCFCTDGPPAGTAEGKSFGVLTLFKDRKELFAPSDEADRWIILLSGFTGVGTYALAKMLTTVQVTTKQTEKQKAMVLQEALEEKPIDLKEGPGVQVLVSVEYDSEIGNQSYDTRTPTAFAICDIKPLPPASLGVSSYSEL